MSLKIYRVLTFILLPFGAFLTINLLGSLITSHVNPLVLFFVFIMGCAPVYIFTSNYFFVNGIRKARPCKTSLKDWIKVNAFVSLVFIAFMLLCCTALFFMLANPALLKEVIDKMPPQQMAGMPGMSPEQLLQLMKAFTAIMLPLSLILLVHIILTFRFLKTYGHMFQDL